MCVNVCLEVLGLLSPWISGYAFSSTLAFSLRLMPLRLAVGATPSFPGPSAPPPPFLTATQRVHPPHWPSSPGPPLCTSNMTTLSNDKLNKLDKSKENNRGKKTISMLPTNQELVTWPRSARVVFTHTCPLDMFPALAIAPVPPLAPRPSLLCEVGP